MRVESPAFPFFKGGAMKLNQKDIHRILDAAKTQSNLQPTRMYWDRDKNKEIRFGDKNLIAILEAMNIVLDVELEVEYEL